jgi:hypothetical protein
MPRSRRDDDDDDRPRRRTRRDRDDEDDDEDDEDDRPSRRRSSRRDDDDDDEDEDDRPRKRKAVSRGRKKAGGSGPLLLVLGLAGGLFVLLAGGVAVWLFVFNDTPERAFEDFKDAAVKKDFGRMYDRMDRDGQREMEKQAEILVQIDRSMSGHSGKKGRDLVVAVNRELDGKATGGRTSISDQMRKDIEGTKVEKVEVNGDTATVTVRLTTGGTRTGKMVKQDGRWRISK